MSPVRQIVVAIEVVLVQDEPGGATPCAAKLSLLIRLDTSVGHR
jgi:hypothetical protein